MKVEIDVPQLMSGEMAKKDRKIVSQAKRIEQLENDKHRLLETLKHIAVAKNALVEAAQWIDPYALCDD